MRILNTTLVILATSCCCCSYGTTAFGIQRTNNASFQRPLGTVAGYASTATLVESPPFPSTTTTPTTISIERTRAATTNVEIVSELLTSQIAIEFSAGQRYVVAAALLSDLSHYFYDAEEDQRMRAISLIEIASTHGIKVSEYKEQMQASMDEDEFLLQGGKAIEAFSKELLLQGQQDGLALDRLMAAVASLQQDNHQNNNNDNMEGLLQSLSSLREEQADRFLDLTKLIESAVPTMDASTIHNLLEEASASAASATSSSDALVAETAAQQDLSFLLQQQEIGEFAPLDHPLIEKAYDYNNNPDLSPVDQVSSSSSPFLQTVQNHLRFFEPVSRGAQHNTPSAYVAAAVDTDYDAIAEALPSTEDILEALPTTEDILEALPTTEDILQAVDSSASDLSDLADSIQQTIFEAETVTQIVETLSQIY